jgi:hypothetical protein
MNRLLSFFGGSAFDTSFYSGWSLRKLRSSYSGFCLEVRRSSDNTLQDIGFDGSGNLDTTALLSFVGAGSGFVRTFYNQSTTASLDFVQTTNANQPRIVNSGTLQTLNGKPSLFFDGTDRMQVPTSTALFNFLHNGSLGCASIVFNKNNVALRRLFGNAAGNTARVGVLVSGETLGRLNNAIVRGVSGTATVINLSATNLIAVNNSYLVITYFDADNATASQRSLMYLNNGSAIVNNANTDAPSTANAFANFSLGDDGVGTQEFTGLISELIVYDKHPDLNNLRTNQLNFYGI